MYPILTTNTGLFSSGDVFTTQTQLQTWITANPQKIIKTITFVGASNITLLITFS